MLATVRTIYELINEFAPFDAAEDYDNVGILAGRTDANVEIILCALDLTPGTIAEAQRLGAQLIVTHHPILFHARKNLREDDAEGALLCRLIRSGVAMIAAHTNFDAAVGGVNDALAGALGLTDVEPHGMMRIGNFNGDFEPIRRLNPTYRVYGRGQIRRMAVCGGAGGGVWEDALKLGADALLTGEVRHHEALGAVQSGFMLIDAGHYETERPSIKAMICCLQTRLDALQYKIRVCESKMEPFA